MKNGYTLIELLIVITIIGLFSALSLAYYNNFNETKKLTKETQRFLSVLDLAKKKSMAGDASMCSSLDPAVTPAVAEYAVNILSASSYQLAPNCTAGLPNTITYNTDPSIVFPNPVGSVAFYPLTANSSSSCVILKNKNTSVCHYINVQNGGTVCDGTCSSCASCACPSSCH